MEKEIPPGESISGFTEPFQSCASSDDEPGSIFEFIEIVLQDVFPFRHLVDLIQTDPNRPILSLGIVDVRFKKIRILKVLIADGAQVPIEIEFIEFLLMQEIFG
ncbi:unnamed protein product [marine sediment metagenome]|uniref:Uncharacterized protein n=1 Tax=marine sediment metagenome TaxID=412755 RepID=X1K4H0_9ZZZZ